MQGLKVQLDQLVLKVSKELHHLWLELRVYREQLVVLVRSGLQVCKDPKVHKAQHLR